MIVFFLNIYEIEALKDISKKHSNSTVTVEHDILCKMFYLIHWLHSLCRAGQEVGA
jgi:hypothetical protein